MTQQFIADASFWQLFPQAQLAVLILDNINNQGESSPAIKQLLAEANLAAKKHLTAEQLSQNPAVAVWREAYQQFKTKKGVRSSIEALLKRIEQGKGVGAASTRWWTSTTPLASHTACPAARKILTPL
jgi:hypothetical protein